MTTAAKKTPVMISTILPPKPQTEQETDRYRLQPGFMFVITDLLVAPSENYGKFAKINGYDLISKQVLKYYTTSVPVIQQLETIIKAAGADDNGKLLQEVKVRVDQPKGKRYLVLVDP